MMEDAQKKAKWAGMPITNIELVMMALATVLAAQHFPYEVDDWEGLLAGSCMWQAWKVAFCLAHLKCQRQLQQAWGGDELLGGAHMVIPTATPNMDHIGKAIQNLALAALQDTTILQQLTRLPTWPSQLWSSCSRQPTRSSQMHWRMAKAA